MKLIKFLTMNKLPFKKLSLKLALVAGVLLQANQSSAQIYAGANVGVNKYLGGELNFIHLGAQVEVPKESNVYGFSFNFGIPRTYEQTFSGYNAFKIPTNISVNGSLKYSPINFTFEFKRYFGGNELEDGGFNAFGGLGLSMVRASYKLDSYDPSYQVSAGENETYFQPIIRAGLGYDLALDFGNIYLNLYTNIPANTVNGADVGISLPLLIGSQAGIKFPIGG